MNNKKNISKKNTEIEKQRTLKENVILALKGGLVGVANIIPGVSGGTLAITLGIYEELISTISHFFSNLKKNIMFLIPLGIGAVIAVLLGSKVLSFCLDKFNLATVLFFVGLIIGGVPMLFKKVKNDIKSPSNWLIFFIFFAFVVILALLKSGDFVVNLSNLNIVSYILLFLVGALAAGTMIIPGISGSFILMLIGYYEPILNSVKDLTNFSMLGHNLAVLMPFGIGVLVGGVLIAKLIEYLLKKYEIKTYCAVLGFVLASIISLILPLIGISINILELIVGILLMALGVTIAMKLGDK